MMLGLSAPATAIGQIASHTLCTRRLCRATEQFADRVRARTPVPFGLVMMRTVLAASDFR